MLGSREAAEDAVQDAFVQAWRQWPMLRDPDRFEAWFHRILVNTCRNQLRSRALRRVEDISSELALAAPSDDLASAVERHRLNQAIASLDPDHRVVVAMRYAADLTIDQIAERLLLPAGTVKSRLHYALRRLEIVLGAESDEVSR